MVAHSEHIDHLIARYLAGEALPEEAVQLDDWLELSEENYGYFASMQKVYRDAKAMAAQPSYNPDAAWLRVKDEMKNVKPVAKVVPLYKRYGAVAAAAAVLLAVGLPLMLFYAGVFTPETTSQLASGATVAKSYKLIDSSEVVLNSHSVVTYSSKYGKKERRLSLKGEAFFAVKHLADKPFLVEANGVLIEDIGTAFNVKAYDTTNTVEVYVETGKVRFYTSASNGIILEAGQLCIYNKTTDTFTIKEAANANMIAYKTKQFAFIDASLGDVVAELSLAYNKQIEIVNPTLNSCRITVNFNNESLDSVLDIIAETLGITVEKSSAGYRLKGSGCGH